VEGVEEVEAEAGVEEVEAEAGVEVTLEVHALHR
jgi:hypothetical protein